MKIKNLFIFLGIIILVIISISFNNKSITEEDFNCIKNSTLYVQLGCSHCLKQEKELGDYYDKFNVIDCFYFPENCSNISATPTWLIYGKYYIGFKKIKELKEINNCSFMIK